MRTDTFLTHHVSGHFRYRQPWPTTRPEPLDFLAIWVIGGTLDATIGAWKVSAAAGDLVLLEPGVPHSYQARAGAGWEWFWLHVDGLGVPDLWQQLQGDGGPVRPLGQDALIRDRFVELVTSAATARAGSQHIKVDTCAASLLGLMVERLEASSEWGTAASRTEMSSLTTWISDHLETPITLNDLAAASGWSTAQLGRIVRRETGLAPMQYVSRLRIRRAERLLLDTELTVARIAQLVGFPDALHFSRRFRQLTGRPPSEVRLSPEQGQQR